jgi:hypothetical protein
MKHFVLAAAFLAGTASLSAFAQSSAPAQPVNGAANSAPDNSSAQSGQWVPPSGQPAQKTRAQVYQELVQAEREARLAQPNLNFHEHP